MSWQLKKRTEYTPPEGPVVLVIMDGVGVGPPGPLNAVELARTPVLRKLRKTAPFMLLKAHGTAVGLPSDEDMGNSEVGHNALGAGRVFAQGASLIHDALRTGSLWQSEVWQKIVTQCTQSSGRLHLLGLLSDGNVHSHIEHLFALLTAAQKARIQQCFVHILLDGRDVPKTSALQYVDALETRLSQLNAQGCAYRIASGGGRMLITMDRYEADWMMVERGWQTHVFGQAEAFTSARTAIETFRTRDSNLSDQYLPAFVVANERGAIGPIRDGDAVVLFNFRGDRAIEISRAFDDETLPYFDRGARPKVFFAGMMQYDGDLQIPKNYLVAPPAIDRTVSAYLAHNGVAQYACSETQKFGHVTYFWNGNRSGKFSAKLETYEEVPSDAGLFSERPWMKAAEITDRVIKAINSKKYPFIRLNYANGDMVGHTGELEPAILAVEAVDLCLGRLLHHIEQTKGIALITADHGNAEDMGRTSHTLNPVPLYLFDACRRQPRHFRDDLSEPGLANIAATLLELLGFEPPTDYAPSLLAR